MNAVKAPFSGFSFEDVFPYLTRRKNSATTARNVHRTLGTSFRMSFRIRNKKTVKARGPNTTRVMQKSKQLPTALQSKLKGQLQLKYESQAKAVLQSSPTDSHCQLIIAAKLRVCFSGISSNRSEVYAKFPIGLKINPATSPTIRFPNSNLGDQYLDQKIRPIIPSKSDPLIAPVLIGEIVQQFNPTPIKTTNPKVGSKVSPVITPRISAKPKVAGTFQCLGEEPLRCKLCANSLRPCERPSSFVIGSLHRQSGRPNRSPPVPPRQAELPCAKPAAAASL